VMDQPVTASLEVPAMADDFSVGRFLS
jgi:hypothetical protein